MRFSRALWARFTKIGDELDSVKSVRVDHQTRTVGDNSSRGGSSRPPGRPRTDFADKAGPQGIYSRLLPILPDSDDEDGGVDTNGADAQPVTQTVTGGEYENISSFPFSSFRSPFYDDDVSVGVGRSPNAMSPFPAVIPARLQSATSRVLSMIPDGDDDDSSAGTSSGHWRTSGMTVSDNVVVNERMKSIFAESLGSGSD